jgi:hypothetical protein
MDLHLSRAALVGAAALALVATATGGAVADRLITGDDIKNHTIERHDLADGAVGPRILRDGSMNLSKLTPRIRQLLATAGTPGPAGAAGAAGTPGAPGLSGYQVVVETVEGPSGTVAVVACPPGKSVLGGGYMPGSFGGVGWQAPAADGSGWRGLLVAPGPGTVTGHLHAICATVR